MPETVRILVVDDEPSVVKMISKRLELEGYDVLVAMDGQEALKKAQTEQPALVILDIMLPKVNGYEVCTMLKQDSRYQKIPILMLSAKAQEKDERLGLDCGADAYLRKPYQAKELLETVKTLLNRSLPQLRANPQSP
jgi:two-component system alkaline phosphatase synthesis response regulator PhoP